LNDKRRVAIFPRWLEYSSAFLAFAGMTSMGIAFTKHGLFCYHGALGYYFGMAIWLFWNDTHAWYAWTAERRGVYPREAQLPQLGDDLLAQLDDARPAAVPVAVS
jgi:hypothetical protein